MTRLPAFTALVLVAASGCLSAPPADTGEPDATVGPDAATTITVSSQPQLPLPDDGGPVEVELVVEPICTVAGVDVDVDITHPYRGDVQIRLTSPTVRTAVLKEEDDDDDGDDVSGNYPMTLTPVDSLELFVGLPATGTWTLTVEDVDAGSIGTLEGCAVNLTCQ